jgi:tetratricopeptide (TPR) repeat protein
MTTLHIQRREFLPLLSAASAGHTAKPARRTWLAMLLLGVCSVATAQTTPANTGTNGDAVRPLSGEGVGSTVQNSSLNAPLFYQLLLGELNLVSEGPGAAYSLILDAARKQRNTQLYRRAVEVALQARSGDAALTAARTWAQDLPQDKDANRFVLQILLALNRVGETAPVVRAILERSSTAERNDTISTLPLTFARVADKPQAAAVVRDVLAPYLKQPAHAAAAWTSTGRMELSVNLLPAALDAARRGHTAEPTAQGPALLALELLERGVGDAESLVLKHLQTQSKDPGASAAVALSYARLLLDLQRNSDAQTQLNQLTQAQPRLPEAWLLLATLQVQDNALAPATRSLQTYMGLQRQASGDDRSARGLTQAYLLMAQISEKQQDFAAANAWLDRIENADDIMAAQLRRASLLARQGQLPQARALLRNLPERRPDDARLKLVAEAQLMRDLKAYQQAFLVYEEAVKRFPDDIELKYDQAMMAEKAGQPTVMETLLRQIIAVQPSYHHAYNALGYSLADRNQRLTEAKQLIEKAVELAPQDAYIQDSLGWVEFRLGNTARALQILKAAFAKRPDPEIAAHLGEVLWVSGQREQALKVWREGLLLSSDNNALQDTLKRLQVKP